MAHRRFRPINWPTTPATVEVNDLTSAVTWANVPDLNITESSVTQHEGAIDHDALFNFTTTEHFTQGAISIPLSQISDVTASAAEVNLLDLAGLTAGWVLSADSATTASWKAPAGGGDTFPIAVPKYTFDSSLVVADPGSGGLRFQSSGLSTNTQMSVSTTDADGNDLNDFWDSVNVGDVLRVNDATDSTVWVLFQITAMVDGTTWWDIDYDALDFNGAVPGNGDEVQITYTPESYQRLDKMLKLGTAPTGGTHQIALVEAGTGGNFVGITSDFTFDNAGAANNFTVKAGRQNFQRDDGVNMFTLWDYGAGSTALIDLTGAVRILTSTKPVLQIAHVADGLSTPGYGTLWVKSSNSDLIFRNGSGTDFNLSDGSTGSGTYLPLSGGVISGDLQVESTDARIYISDTDAAVNEGDWLIQSTAGTFRLYAANDAHSSHDEFLRVNRSASTVTSLVLGTASTGATITASSLDLQSGPINILQQTLNIYDTTELKRGRFSHGAADFDLSFDATNTTTDWNIDSAQNLTGQIKIFTDTHFVSGTAVQIRDAGDNDTATFSHDGTDFNTVFTEVTGTTDWNITGLAALETDTFRAVKYNQCRTETTTNLIAIAHAVNTDAGKVQGAMVYNSTTDQPVWATGNTDGAVWVDATGTTAHTPV